MKLLVHFPKSYLESYLQFPKIYFVTKENPCSTMETNMETNFLLYQKNFLDRNLKRIFHSFTVVYFASSGKIKENYLCTEQNISRYLLI